MGALPSQADAPPPPTHVAIIMDGNGRWARARALPRTAGHRRGAEAVRKTVRGAAQLGVGYLTLYGFSSENWKRPASEVDDLMTFAIELAGQHALCQRHTDRICKSLP